MKVVHSYNVIGSGSVYYEAWESKTDAHRTPTYSTFSEPMGAIATRAFHSDTLQRFTTEHADAATKWAIANQEEALDLIFEAYPELREIPHQCYDGSVMVWYTEEGLAQWKRQAHTIIVEK